MIKFHFVHIYIFALWNCFVTCGCIREYDRIWQQDTKPSHFSRQFLPVFHNCVFSKPLLTDISRLRVYCIEEFTMQQCANHWGKSSIYCRHVPYPYVHKIIFYFLLYFFRQHRRLQVKACSKMKQKENARQTYDTLL